MPKSRKPIGHALPVVSPRFSPYLKRWKDLSSDERSLEIMRCALQHGGYAVTLHPRPDYARDLRSKDRPVRALSKRFWRVMKKSDLGDLKIILAIEIAPSSGRLHLHGVVLPGTHPLPLIKSVLRDGAKRISGRSGSRQVTLKRLYDAAGWLGYMQKDKRLTRKLLTLAKTERLVWCSRSMIRLASVTYEQRRAAAIKAANLASAPAKIGA